MSGHQFVAAAFRNLISSFDRKVERELPDLVLHNDENPIQEYHNYVLIPGMYPTLFPFGVGGFEDPSHFVSLAFAAQASVYFDIPDHIFRYHHSYIFVVLNIIQWHKAHLHTSFAMCKTGFDDFSKELVGLSPSVIQSAAHHLENKRNMSNLNHEQKKALHLLKHVNTISAKIPGSQAFKTFTCSEMRGFMGLFGLPTLYFTANLNPLHSPIFQVMSGDITVDLTEHFQISVRTHERTLRLARDPMAAADFFEFSIRSIFQHLFGWDFSLCRSKDQGGIV
ncbi:hypothetical protein EV702DRAFT_978743 [Suillus placidus]|uniref:Helitron helicase-like domain-containing protein n=1 Tax=Suillus placidus TaxID=48579 RepID=A0A9P7CYJ5_9AGAM|nr:hypothetical protein EV702DRAFT_978743 [Suillus placidus]